MKRCNSLKQQVVILDDLFRGGTCGDFFPCPIAAPFLPPRIYARETQYPAVLVTGWQHFFGRIVKANSEIRTGGAVISRSTRRHTTSPDSPAFLSPSRHPHTRTLFTHPTPRWQQERLSMETALERLTRLVYGTGNANGGGANSSSRTSKSSNNRATPTAASTGGTGKHTPTNPWKPPGGVGVVPTGGRGHAAGGAWSSGGDGVRAACSPIGVNVL